MEAIQFYPSHPGYLRHHFQHNDSEERLLQDSLEKNKTPKFVTKKKNS